MKIITYLSNEQEKITPPENLEELIESLTAAALEEEGIDDTAEVSVTLVDNSQIKELNKEHRKIDRETDVLSFPLGDDENGYEINPDTNAIMLGDIVVSLEQADIQAKEYGHSFKREVAFLIAHSLFHLLGYDHMTPDEEKEMSEKQERILLKLGITREA